MAAGAASRVLRVPGRLVANPTNLQLAFPFGGTEVGLVREVRTQALGPQLVVQSEGLGAPSDVLEPAERYLMACFLRGWDDDAVRLLFSGNQVQGALSGHRTLRIPGDVQPGASALSRAVTLLYVPDNRLDAPALLLHRAVVFWTEAQDIQFRRQEELGIPIVAECVRDSSDRVLEIGRLADLSL